ncbi:hypothetical protein LTS63_00915 [Mycobacterium intracellulare]|uniref:hypothetical protein n=1 Tax=Mycobacterium intracellulare TaxID=1767 RepID=UPI001CDB375E|nr:hypothetical protein [Mycobacterium intracellulare]MCA2254430.1 hypothetical protein [Mycobacterium intracellulare]UGU02374.1 hypothetical protein LTS63_00915 [Mycobacterium intracellulare]
MRNLAVNVGLVPLRARLCALHPFIGAPQSRAFLLFARALAFVRALLSFVRRPLALVGNLVALIGEAIPFAGKKFTLSELSLLPDQGPFALLERVGPAFRPLGRLGAVVCGHSSP